MVKTSKDIIDLEHVDFSIMPSLECDLSCSFCMYNCSTKNKLTLDLNTFKQFCKTIDWTKIKNCGFYGGEPAINMSLYQSFIDLIPKNMLRFTITNGSWSNNYEKGLEFIKFCSKNKLSVIVSGTEEHRQFQDRTLLQKLMKYKMLYLKDEDEIHPMGRAKKETWKCSHKCLWHKQPIRMAIFPTGHIIFQNCDGVYPILGNCSDTFDFVLKRAILIRKATCKRTYLTINEVLESYK